VAASATNLAVDVAVDPVMAEVQGRVRERLRAQLLSHGGSPAFQDPTLFADVERLLQAAAATGEAHALILPELLGDPESWRLSTAMHYRTHRGRAGSLIVGLKRRVMMPVLRWLFEYSRDNFERQRRVNHVLFACVQELAVETARLRQEVSRLSK
jgi:hypothetical protein